MNTKFDIQLAHGLQAENTLGQRLAGDTIELKTESWLWERTGNICIEYQYRGRPSGIAATEANWWCHELRVNNQTLIYLMIPVPALKKVCAYYYRQGKTVAGGDNNWSRMILIPTKDLIKTMLSCYY